MSFSWAKLCFSSSLLFCTNQFPSVAWLDEKLGLKKPRLPDADDATCAALALATDDTVFPLCWRSWAGQPAGKPGQLMPFFFCGLHFCFFAAQTQGVTLALLKRAACIYPARQSSLVLTLLQLFALVCFKLVMLQYAMHALLGGLLGGGEGRGLGGGGAGLGAGAGSCAPLRPNCAPTCRLNAGGHFTARYFTVLGSPRFHPQDAKSLQPFWNAGGSLLQRWAHLAVSWHCLYQLPRIALCCLLANPVFGRLPQTLAVEYCRLSKPGAAMSRCGWPAPQPWDHGGHRFFFSTTAVQSG